MCTPSRLSDGVSAKELPYPRKHGTAGVLGRRLVRSRGSRGRGRMTLARSQAFGWRKSQGRSRAALCLGAQGSRLLRLRRLLLRSGELRALSSTEIPKFRLGKATDVIEKPPDELRRMIKRHTGLGALQYAV